MSGMEPILIGAAVGAGTSALTGSDPLKGALFGGATGGIGNALKVAGAGSLLDGIKTIPTKIVDPVKNLFTTAATEGAENLAVPVVTEAAQSGLVWNPATKSFINPEFFALANTSNPIYTGADSIGSKIVTGAQSLLETPTMQGLKEYMPSPQALGQLGLQGAMQSLMMPRVQAPAGGITPGRPIDASAVQALVSSMRRKPPQGILSDYFG